MNNSTKAIVSKIDLGFAEVEGLMLPDGSYAIAVPQIADLFGYSRVCASQSLKRLMGEDFKTHIMSTEFNKKPVNIVKLEDFKKIVCLLAQKGNPAAIELLNKINNNGFILKSVKEKEKKKKKKSEMGYIYLFEGVNVLKLGYSKNVKQRLKTLSRWNGELELVAVKKGTMNKEKTIHSILHSTGDSFGDEWYPAYRKYEILKVMGVSLDPDLIT